MSFSGKYLIVQTKNGARKAKLYTTPSELSSPLAIQTGKSETLYVESNLYCTEPSFMDIVIGHYDTRNGTNWIYRKIRERKDGESRPTSLLASLTPSTSSKSFNINASENANGLLVEVRGGKGANAAGTGGKGAVSVVKIPANAALSLNYYISGYGTAGNSGTAGSTNKAYGCVIDTSTGYYKCTYTTVKTSASSGGSGGATVTAIVNGINCTATGGGGGGGSGGSASYYSSCSATSSGSKPGKCSLSNSKTVTGTNGTGGGSSTVNGYNYGDSTTAEIRIYKYTSY